MIFIDKKLEISPIQNAETVLRTENGKPYCYLITPLAGFKLHDKALDIVILDESGNATGEFELGFYSGTRTVAASYSFAENPREFYTVEVA